jgi:uncharacterized protein (DUF2141 family)
MSVSRFACATLAMLAFSPLWSNAAPTDATVRVEIASLRNTQGDVGCLIFNSPDGYPQTHAKAYKELHAAIDGDHAVCEFKDVMQGTYAVIVFHDENKNGKMDKNFLGIPQEGYVASNNVRPLMSAPEFKEASFAVPAASVTAIKLQIRY